LAGALAAAAQEPKTFTHADTLRGTNGPARSWWDVTFYDLHVRIDPADSTIRGENGITYTVLPAGLPVSGVADAPRQMQIDLMTPLEVDSMIQDGISVPYRRDGNAFFATLRPPQRAGDRKTIRVFYHGRPRIAAHPPWDGGFVWTRDSSGHLWVATACQGVGASVWWPNKDIQADEPDSQRVAVTVPDPMIDVSNGRLRSTVHHTDGTTTYEWFVTSPINNYDVAVNAGAYTHLQDSVRGERGMLSLDYWPLADHVGQARTQFAQVKPMLACFEHWFGPYPWYADGYKLVEAPYLGMEHQSAVAYGNGYLNGYRGRDLSGTGLGLRWDFIIVHESGHEWFGNNITTADIADMWVHEGFTNYSEGLYTECQQGTGAGAAYVRGLRGNVQNDRPIIGAYGVNDEGSGDMYYKASNMLQTIRQIVADDERWRGMLRGLNATFWHRVVTGAEVQAYMNRTLGLDLTPMFTQYLTTTKIPVLRYRFRGGTVSYRWTNVVPGFDMPVDVSLGGRTPVRLYPTEKWQTVSLPVRGTQVFVVESNFYVTAEREK